MKRLKKYLSMLLLTCILILGNLFSVQAAKMQNFPQQSKSNYTAKYAKAIQVMMLNFNSSTRGFITQSGGADGSYGSGTVNAVKAFQGAKRLDPDGICGEDTWYALRFSLISTGRSGNYTYYSGPYPYYSNKYNMRQTYLSSGDGGWYGYYGASWFYVG